MSVMLDGYSSCDSMYKKAYWAKASLDCAEDVFNLEDATDNCLAYLKERQKNPTLGDIAYAEAVRKNPIAKGSNYSQNFAKLEKQPLVDGFFREISKANKKIYPKTARVRHDLIIGQRFRLNEVLPKLTGFKKFAIKYL